MTAAALHRLAQLPRAARDFVLGDAAPATCSIAGAVVQLTLVLVAGACFGLVAALATALALLGMCFGAAIWLIVDDWPAVDVEE